MPSAIASAYVELRATTETLTQDLARGRGYVVTGIEAIAAAAKGAFSGLAAVGSMLSQPMNIAMGLWGAFKTFAEATVGTALRVVDSFRDNAMATFTGIAILINNGMGAALGGVINLIESGLIGVLGGLASVASTVFGAISSVLKSILNIAAEVIKGVTQLVTSVVSAIMTVVSTAAGAVTSFAGKLMSAITGPVTKALQADLLDFQAWTEKALEAEVRATKLATLLRGTGEAAGWSALQLRQMARELVARGMGSTAQIEEAQAVLLRYTAIQGNMFRAALEASGQLAALRGGEINDTIEQLGRVLEHPAHGFERLERSAGIAFNETDRQILKASANFKAGSREFEAAQQVIINAVARYGDVAGNRLQTTSGKIQQLGRSWESIGQSLGKVFAPLVEVVVNFLTPLIEGFGGRLKQLFGGMRDGAETFAQAANRWIEDNRATIVQWGRYLGDIVAAVWNVFRDFVTWGGQALGGLFGLDSRAGVDSWRDAITRALAVVKATLGDLPSLWDAISSKIEAVWINLAGKMRATMTSVINDLRIEFAGMFAAISENARITASNFGAWFRNLHTSIIDEEDRAFLVNKARQEARNREGQAIGAPNKADQENDRRRIDDLNRRADAAINRIMNRVPVDLGGTMPKQTEEMRQLQAILNQAWQRRQDVKGLPPNKRPEITADEKAAMAQMVDALLDVAQRNKVLVGVSAADSVEKQLDALLSQLMHPEFAGGQAKELEKDRLDKELEAIRAIAAAAGLGKVPTEPDPKRQVSEQVKFGFTGLSDMWKKMQESISGSSMLAINRDILAAGQQTKANTAEAAQLLQQIRDKLPTGPPPAVAK